MEKRRSTTGYLLYVYGGPVAWKVHLQSVIAKSSVEAEYYAFSETCDEIVCHRSLLVELGIVVAGPTILYGDNKGSIDLASAPVFHKRTKHIEIRYHLIREHIDNGIIEVIWCLTADNIADIFTKALPTIKHVAMRGFIVG